LSTPATISARRPGSIPRPSRATSISTSREREVEEGVGILANQVCDDHRYDRAGHAHHEADHRCPPTLLDSLSRKCIGLILARGPTVITPAVCCIGTAIYIGGFNRYHRLKPTP
jgi:hypothetical protein